MYEDDYYKYKLRGIVIHLGTAEFGHYYSFTKLDGSWYEFNDTIVMIFSFVSWIIIQIIFSCIYNCKVEKRTFQVFEKAEVFINAVLLIFNSWIISIFLIFL